MWSPSCPNLCGLHPVLIRVVSILQEKLKRLEDTQAQKDLDNETASEGRSLALYHSKGIDMLEKYTGEQRNSFQSLEILLCSA